MKPGFALDLSHDGIGLLHRGSGRWNLVGEVSLDDPQLATTLKMLRGTASDLEGGGVLTKLILPDSQILYTRLPLAGGSIEQQEAKLRAGLDGLTPYRVDDLVFDWVADGNGAAQLAVVARETLEEAEAFAVQHNFNPVCFVAAPTPDRFPREPWFGRTRAADDLLSDGEELERDSTPVIRATAPLETETEAEGETDSTPESIADDAATSAQDTSCMSGAPDSGQVEMPKADMNPPLRNPAAKTATDDTETNAPPEVISDAKPPDGRDTTRSDAPSPPPLMSPLQPPQTRPTFLSGRHGRSRESASDTGQTGEIVPRITLFVPQGDDAPMIGPATRPGAEVTAAVAPLPEPGSPVPSNAPETGDKDADKTAKQGQAGRKRKAPAPAPKPRVDIKPSPKRSAPRAIPIALPPATEAEALTVFGARGKEGRHGLRPGLILTIALLVLMGGGALWSAFFMFERSTAPAPNAQQSAETPASPAQDDAIAALPEAGPSEPPLSTTTPRQPDRAAVEPLPDMVGSTPRQTGNIPGDGTNTGGATGRPTQEEAVAIHARTGVWPRAPDVPESPVPSNLNGIYIAGTDPVIPGHDVAPLPDPTKLTPAPPARPMLPPPPGVVFELDERGLVTPTPEGTLSPSGNMIYSGRPPVVPPPRPETDAGLAPEAQQATDPERTRLAAFRPRPRPEIPESLQERTPADPQVEVDETAAAESLLPAGRPAGFAAAVEDAVEAAQAPATMQPDIPTSASVARRATIESVINLREMNLIGVYGPSSERRALVRLSSGRYLKVQVGDRLDGGRVAAISESALRYVKNGRNIVMEMPEG